MASDFRTRIVDWQHGEDAAVRAVFEEFYPSAVRIAGLSGLSSENAQDCAQTAFIRAFERRRQLRDPVAFPLWFYRIVSRTIFGFIQEQQSHPTQVMGAEDEVGEDWQRRHSPLPEDIVLAAEDRARIWQQIELLSPRTRMILVLHYYQGFNLRQVAAIMEAREGTVRVALHRALHHLRTALQSIPSPAQ